MVPELEIVKRVMLKASDLGWRLFRNNVGVGWAGKAQVKHEKDGSMTVVVRNAYPLRAGLHIGSPDCVGWIPVVVTQEMVGKKIAVFLGAEVKTETGRLSDEQKNFLYQLGQAGGVAVVARCGADLEQIPIADVGVNCEPIG